MLPRCHWRPTLPYDSHGGPTTIALSTAIHSILIDALVRTTPIDLCGHLFLPLNLRRLYVRRFITRSIDLITCKGKGVLVVSKAKGILSIVWCLNQSRTYLNQAQHPKSHRAIKMHTLLIYWCCESGESLQAWILIWCCLEIFMASSNCFNVSKAMGA